MNKKGIGIILFIIIFFIICYFIGESTNRSYATTDEFSEDEQAELNEIDVDKYIQLKNGKDVSVIYIARPDCSHCIVQTPRMKYIKYKYQVEINYLNTNAFSDDGSDYDKVIASDTYFKDNELGTPLILIVKEGKILDKIEGESPVEDVVTLFSKNGLI